MPRFSNIPPKRIVKKNVNYPALYQGQRMVLIDIIEKEKFTLKMSQKSKIGNVASSTTIRLISENGNVIINFSGEARISGLLARTSQRLINGVAKKLTKDFFRALDSEISN